MAIRPSILGSPSPICSAKRTTCRRTAGLFSRPQVSIGGPTQRRPGNWLEAPGTKREPCVIPSAVFWRAWKVAPLSSISPPSSAPGSEALLYYDHRHDDYVAGLKVRGLGSGVIGHFGASARWFFNERFGIAADAQVGAAVMAGASFIFKPAAPHRRVEVVP